MTTTLYNIFDMNLHNDLRGSHCVGRSKKHSLKAYLEAYKVANGYTNYSPPMPLPNDDQVDIVCKDADGNIKIRCVEFLPRTSRRELDRLLTTFEVV